MRGYQITFYTLQNQTHAGRPLATWLVQTAEALGLRGATLNTAAEGFGHDHRLHAARFFELADQPQVVTLIVSEDESQRLFAALAEVQVFYTRVAVEYGRTGSGD